MARRRVPHQARVKAAAAARRRDAETRIMQNNITERQLPFDAAGQGRRSLGNPTTSGPNAIMRSSLDRLRTLSRDAVRQNGYAKAAVDLLTTAVIGKGIRPVTTDEDLQWLWRQWTAKSDPTGMTTFYGQQAMLFRSMIEGGDSFGRLRPRLPEDGVPANFQFQLIEGDHIPTWKTDGGVGNNAVIGGIEWFNSRPVAYHMYRDHPGDFSFDKDFRSLETVRVPAESVIHAMSVIDERIGAVRGLPFIARALIKLSDYHDYDQAELLKKKLNTLWAAFFKKPSEDSNLQEILGGDPGSQVVPAIEPGSAVAMPPGWDVVFSNPTEVGGSYDPFTRQQLRAVCVAIGVPPSLLTHDFTGLNDRLLRGVLLWFKKRCEMLQQAVVIPQICQPIWEHFVTMAVASGAWKPKPGQNLEEIMVPEWVPQAHPHLHQLQEVQANSEAFKLRTKSLTQIASEYGVDLIDVFNEIEAEQKLALEKGITLPEPTSISGIQESLLKDEIGIGQE